jgi:GxxExxY protein
VKLDAQELPHLIIGACMEVHRHLGPGLMAEAYRDCLALELRMREIIFHRDHPLPIAYKGHLVDGAVRVDFLVEGSVIITTTPPDLGEATKQHMKNVLRLTGVETGLLVNFNVDNLRDGVKRIIVSELPPALHYQT